MLIRLLRLGRHLLQTVLLALLQPAVLLGGLLVRELLGEQRIVEQRRRLVVDGTVKHHPVVLLVVRVHLGLRQHRHTHLALQDRATGLTTAYGMHTVAGRLGHLHQPQLVLPADQLTHDLAALLTVAAVDVVEEERAHRLHAPQHSALLHLTAIAHLHQRTLIAVVTRLAVLVPVLHVLLRVAGLHQHLSALHGTGDLAPVPVNIDQINHSLNKCLLTKSLNKCLSALNSEAEASPLQLERGRG